MGRIILARDLPTTSNQSSCYALRSRFGATLRGCVTRYGCLSLERYSMHPHTSHCSDRHDSLSLSFRLVNEIWSAQSTLPPPIWVQVLPYKVLPNLQPRRLLHRKFRRLQHLQRLSSCCISTSSEERGRSMVHPHTARSHLQYGISSVLRIRLRESRVQIERAAFDLHMIICVFIVKYDRLLG
jgi:hypothetical protein